MRCWGHEVITAMDMAKREVRQLPRRFGRLLLLIGRRNRRLGLGFEIKDKISMRLYKRIYWVVGISLLGLGYE